MKAKIMGFDPTGVEVEAESFQLPLVPEPKTYPDVEIDGIRYIPLPNEPMRKIRYMLVIGEYKYWIRSDGSLDEHSCNKLY